ncbi:MAG TPA: hypothetical protein VF318_05770 [Dehalococcoidales bacterium]
MNKMVAGCPLGEAPFEPDVVVIETDLEEIIRSLQKLNEKAGDCPFCQLTIFAVWVKLYA